MKDAIEVLLHRALLRPGLRAVEGAVGLNAIVPSARPHRTSRPSGATAVSSPGSTTVTPVSLTPPSASTLEVVCLSRIPRVGSFANRLPRGRSDEDLRRGRRKRTVQSLRFDDTRDDDDERYARVIPLVWNFEGTTAPPVAHFATRLDDARRSFAREVSPRPRLAKPCLCATHYRISRAHGDPRGPLQKTEPTRAHLAREHPATTAMSSTLAALQQRKDRLDEELKQVEKQVYDLETSHLNDSSKYGNVLKGFEGYLSQTKNTSQKKSAKQARGSAFSKTRPRRARWWTRSRRRRRRRRLSPRRAEGRWRRRRIPMSADPRTGCTTTPDARWWDGGGAAPLGTASRE